MAIVSVAQAMGNQVEEENEVYVRLLKVEEQVFQNSMMCLGRLTAIQTACLVRE